MNKKFKAIHVVFKSQRYALDILDRKTGKNGIYIE